VAAIWDCQTPEASFLEGVELCLLGRGERCRKSGSEIKVARIRAALGEEVSVARPGPSQHRDSGPQDRT
jgi:hypothetical protein